MPNLPSVKLVDNIFVKQCSKCNEFRKLEEFYKASTLFLGLRWECKKCTDVVSKQWKKDNKEQHAAINRKYNYKKKFNITVEDYDKLYLEQEGKCKICNKEFKILDVDHDHKTGTVRGLLCSNCNVSIGLLQDDPFIILKAADYLINNIIEKGVRPL